MTTEKTATKRLLKKLTALRVTLPTEEQNILDSLILTEVEGDEEVEAHRLASNKINPARTTSNKTFAGKTSVKKAEVGAMPEDDEVEAHAMTSAGKADAGRVVFQKTNAGRVIFQRASVGRVIFNKDTGEYTEE